MSFAPRCRAPLLAACACLYWATSAAAQPVKYENPTQGYRLYVSKKMRAVPVAPNEQQILARWAATLEFEGGASDGQHKCTLWLVRIAKTKAPTTTPSSPNPNPSPAPSPSPQPTAPAPDGRPPKPPDAPAPAPAPTPADDDDSPTLRDVSTEQLNAATDLPGFLQRRGLRLEPYGLGKEKAPRNRAGQPYTGREWTGRQDLDVRTYVVEDDREILGFVAFGPFVDPFKDLVLDAAKSLERIQAGADPKAVDYEKKNLGNGDFRAEVRRKLVRGWQAFDTEHFIFVTNSKSKTVTDRMLIDLELMRGAYLERFPPVAGADMDGVISAVRFCATLKDYQDYGGPPGTGGYWNAAQEELVLVDMLGENKEEILKHNPNLKNMQVEDILYHEAMHQYFWYANGQVAPAPWFNEGFGEVFAGAVPDRSKGKVQRIDRNRFRMWWIVQARSYPPLRPLLQKSRQEFYAPALALQNYAFAWAFCHFLELERRDPKGNREWGAIPDRYLQNLRAATERARGAAGDGGKAWSTQAVELQIQKDAFQRTFAGMDLGPLEAAWAAAMKKWK